MRIRYTDAAEADIESILSYLIERNPYAAAAVGATIEATAARIVMFPESAQATNEPTVRMAPVGRYPYLVFYTVTADEVRIIRVLHGARLRPWESEE